MTRFVAITLVFSSAATLLASQPQVVVTADFAQKHQAIAGFGEALSAPLKYGSPGDLTDVLRSQGIDAAFGQVRLNLGLAGNLVEGPPNTYPGANDDNDPFHINWAGFQGTQELAYRQYVIDFAGASGHTAKQLGFTGYFVGGNTPNVRYASPWLDTIRSTNYSLFLDECAEQVLADVLYYRNTFSDVPIYYQLGNEELTGNRILFNTNGTSGPIDRTQQMIDIIIRAGARLQATNVGPVKFLIGTEETEEASLALAGAVLTNAAARPFVGIIGYHTYPYGSIYSSVSNILATSGSGYPDAGRIAVRLQLRSLAQQYNLPVWLTENSHGETGSPGINALSYDAFRARAIHIHDEFLYTEASAYFCEGAMWDLNSQRLHFGSNSDLFGSEGNAVFINNDTGVITIAAMGYAMGHYARWLRPGSKRVEALSNTNLVLVSAFQDSVAGRAVFVLINNDSAVHKTSVNTTNIALVGTVIGELSTSNAYWQPVPPFPITNQNNFLYSLPPKSVATLVAPYLGAPFYLSIAPPTNGLLTLTISGQDSQVYELQATTNLQSWTSVGVATNRNGFATVTRPWSSATPFVFYRASLRPYPFYLSIAPPTNGLLTLTISGQDSQVYELQTTTNLQSWTSVAVATNRNGFATVTLPWSSAASAVFYRASLRPVFR